LPFFSFEEGKEKAAEERENAFLSAKFPRQRQKEKRQGQAHGHYVWPHRHLCIMTAFVERNDVESITQYSPDQRRDR
jgi:hypothetical protein